MDDLLEVHLRTEIDQARSNEDRESATSSLAAFYLDMIRTEPKGSARRELLLSRAWDLTTGVNADQLIGLRVELLINRYLPIEQTVELHLILLDDPNERARGVKQLTDIQRRFGHIETLMRSDVRGLERRLKSFRKDDKTESLQEQLDNAKRNLSLARYYIGWCGYSLGVLKDRSVPNEPIEAFGWLLGAKGAVPKLEDLEHAALEFDHVARAAIGVALCKARNGDLITARSWIRRILKVESLNPEIRDNAQTRLLQIEATGARWDVVLELIEQIHRQRNEPLRIDEARFVAIAVLDNERQSKGKNRQAQEVAQAALEDLIKRGEIGHVLDLHKRYGSLPLIANRFLSQYASALMALDEAERPETGGLFATAATLFSKAMKSEDADQYPEEKGDCALKLAYCLIKSKSPADAIGACDALIETEPSDELLEQARWLRIVAIEMLIADGQKKQADTLEESVREYIVAYPDSINASRLLIRHSLGNMIDPQLAINALMQMPVDDPGAVAARRMLVQLYHQQYRASRRTDTLAKEKAIELVRWLWESTPDEAGDPREARTRLSIIRMVLDMTRQDQTGANEIAARAILRGILLIDTHPSLSVHKDELLLRRVEFLLVNGDQDRAERQVGLMNDPSGIFAIAAMRMVFVASLDAWNGDPTNLREADRVVALGIALIESTLPPAPEKLSGQDSAIIGAVARAAEFQGQKQGDQSSTRLSFRMCKLIFERGLPDDDTLRRTARLASFFDDPETELQAWLELLARSLPTEPAWYGARYESFRVMLRVDPDRARLAINQYRVLHPNPAPEPWTEKLQTLLGAPVQGDSDE
ncbi:MAG: hypothetical protein JKY96_01005 [Phycisphaerales bacterium]|nr:hypothetical protein [Phycisphaerales bacterium]